MVKVYCCHQTSRKGQALSRSLSWWQSSLQAPAAWEKGLNYSSPPKPSQLLALWCCIYALPILTWAQGISFQALLPRVTGGHAAQKALPGPILSASRGINLLSSFWKLWPSLSAHLCLPIPLSFLHVTSGSPELYSTWLTQTYQISGEKHGAVNKCSSWEDKGREVMYGHSPSHLQVSFM